VDFLIALGADPNETTVYGFTPIMAAASRGHLEIIHSLISHGGIPTAKADNGQSAKDFALENGHKEIVIFLQSL
jgi:ankyrin repeat protein